MLTSQSRWLTLGGLITVLALHSARSAAQLGLTFPTALASQQPQNLAADREGNVYVAASASSVVWKVAPDGAKSIVAGSGTAGFSGDGGPAVSAELKDPTGVAVDAAGNLYIADTGNLRIRKVTREGLIDTIAGNGVIGTGGDGGPATAAQLRSPQGITIDAAGNLYIADLSNYRVRKMTPEGVISTIAGNGVQGSEGDNGPAVAAQLNNPIGLAVDNNGSLYIAGNQSFRIRKVTRDGTIRTIAGTGAPGFSGDGGPATMAQISNAVSIAVDENGNLYIADQQNSRIRQVSPGGVIRTIAGNGAPGYSGDGGQATTAQMRTPLRIASDGSESLFIVDGQTPGIRKIAADGIINTIPFALPPAPVTTAPVALNQIQPLYTDEARKARVTGTVILDTIVRKDGTVQVSRVVRGLGYGLDEAAIAAASQWLFRPAMRDETPVDANVQMQIGFRAAENAPSAAGPLIVPVSAPPSAVPRPGYVAPYAIHSPGPTVSESVLRRGIRGTVLLDLAIDEAGNVVDVRVSRSLDCELDEIAVKTVRTWKFEPARQDGRAEKAPVKATVNFAQILASGSPTPPVSAAQLKNPAAVAVDSAGNLYVANTGNARLRKVTPKGEISVLGRGTPGFWGDGGPAVLAEMRNPSDVVADSIGNIYVADTGNHRIRRIAPPGNVIGTAIGKGTAGFTGDGGSATCAQLHSPEGIAIDRAGTIYIADTGNNRIRKATLDGKIDTVAGNGTRGFGGDGGKAVSASLNTPSGVAVDAQGNIYIADTGNNRIRKVTSDGTISTVAGDGAAGFKGDGNTAATARLKSPSSIAVDPSGILYIADTGNARIRKVTIDGVIDTVAGNGTIGFGGDGSQAISAQLKSPSDVALDAAGNLYIADTGNNLVRKVTPAGVVTTVTGSAP